MDLSKEAAAIEKAWRGRKIKHLDSVPQLGSARYPLLRIREIARRSLTARSAVEINFLEDMAVFLTSCQYVPDPELHGSADRWQTAEQFEALKKGDCEEFSLWSWKKLLVLGYDARLTLGRFKGGGHVWVTLFIEGAAHIYEGTQGLGYSVEPTTTSVQRAQDYEPHCSIDARLQFYRHV